MDKLSSKQIREINSLYESIYVHGEEIITEEEYYQKISEEFLYEIVEEVINSLIEEGYISNDVIKEGLISKALAKSPQVYTTLKGIAQKLTGFGLGQSSGGKRRIITTGAGTAAALDPQKAAEKAGMIVKGAYGAATGAVKGGMEAVKDTNGQEKKSKSNTGTTVVVTPQGDIKVR